MFIWAQLATAPSQTLVVAAFGSHTSHSRNRPEVQTLNTKPHADGFDKKRVMSGTVQQVRIDEYNLKTTDGDILTSSC